MRTLAAVLFVLFCLTPLSAEQQEEVAIHNAFVCQARQHMLRFIELGINANAAEQVNDEAQSEVCFHLMNVRMIIGEPVFQTSSSHKTIIVVEVVVTGVVQGERIEPIQHEHWYALSIIAEAPS